MPQRILGVDLGSWSVKAVLAESAFRGYSIEACYEVPVGRGSLETESERQIEALSEILATPGLKPDTVVAAMPGEVATMRTVELPFSDSRKIEATMEGELADLLPFDVYEAVFDHTLQEKLEDGASRSLAAAAREEDVREHLELLSDAGIDPRFLPVDVLQLYNLYTHFLHDDASRPEAPKDSSHDASTFVVPDPYGPADGRMLVDIGHERTIVLAAYNGGIAHMRVLRHGGREVTKVIAEAYQLGWDNAEACKHEDGFVASARHPASSDATQRMSEVVASGLRALVLELRRTLLAIRREKRMRVARVDLLGGGARIRNLAAYLGEQLNVPTAFGAAVEQVVERHVEPERRGAHALALALTLRAAGDEPVSTIDLRQGALAFAGQLQNLRARVPFIAGAAAVLMGFVLVLVVVQYRVVAAREAAVDEQFCLITQKVVGKRVCEPSVAISRLREPTTELGNFKLPEKSAFRMAADISKAIPDSVDTRVREMDIRPNQARLVGETTSFDAVDKLVAALDADSCITDIKKGNLLKKSDGQGVEFQLKMDLECSQ